MKALRTKVASELNNPARWNRHLKPWFDVQSFQQRINDRAGLNRDGQPIIRLVWGQEATQTAFHEQTPRYWTKRQRTGPGEFQWYTVPRWIFERRLEPEQYVDSWNKTRYSITDPTVGTNQRCEDCGSGGDPELVDGKLYCRNCMSTNISGGAVVDKGPPPSEYYIFMMEAAEHEGMTDPVNGWPLCCTRNFYTDRMRCWGEYRHPGELDLEVIAQSVRAMESAKFADPYRALTVAELQEAEVAANMQVEMADQAMKQYEAAMMADFMKTHGWRIRGESQPLFMDYGTPKTEGGIILPE